MIALFFMAGIGGFCGLVAALIFKRQPLLVAVIISAVAGTVAEVIFFGIGEASSDYSQNGYSLGKAIQAGIGAAVLMGMSAPITGGLPAALFGYVCHRLFHASSKKPSA